MPDQYAVVCGPIQIDPPFAGRDKTSFPVARHVSDWPRTDAELLDGPYDALRDAQVAFLRLIGAL